MRRCLQTVVCARQPCLLYVTLIEPQNGSIDPWVRPAKSMLGHRFIINEGPEWLGYALALVSGSIILDLENAHEIEPITACSECTNGGWLGARRSCEMLAADLVVVQWLIPLLPQYVCLCLCVCVSVCTERK